jgi:hypothetical protein
MTHLKGPMVVISSRGSEYTVRDLSTNVDKYVNVMRLRPFRYDPTRVDPKEVAAADDSVFYVEAIRDHLPKGYKRPRKGDLKFLVKWFGYDETENTWEPWSELTRNTIVHAYCRANGMTGVVSKAYDPSDSD